MASAVRGIPAPARTSRVGRMHLAGQHPQPRTQSRHVAVRVAEPPVQQPQGVVLKEALTADGANTYSTAFGDEYFSAADSRPVILFDGVCNLCNGGVNMTLDWDKDAVYRFAALQSDAGKALLQRSGRRPDDISSICLVTKDGHWIKSQAVMKIAQRLAMPLPVLAAVSTLLNDEARNVVYDAIADNRYKIFGESAECRLMQPEWRDRFLA